jgi:hypothetical protein
MNKYLIAAWVLMFFPLKAISGEEVLFRPLAVNSDGDSLKNRECFIKFGLGDIQ